MSAKNKVRSYKAENYVVERCEHYGIPAERAWASDGRAMGLSARDDGQIGWMRWQCKRFKWHNVVRWFVNNAIDYLQGEQHVVTFYVDRGQGHPRTVYTILDLETFLRLYQQAEHNKKRGQDEVQD